MTGRKAVCATPWCNGSTTGFGPVSLGSSPGGVANFFLKGSVLCVGE